MHLTQTAPFTISPGELIVYDVVDAKTVSRSSVLSCITDAGGDARLPEAVSVPEFRAWVTACAASKEDRMLTPFPTLCTILKVAFAATLFQQHGVVFSACVAPSPLSVSAFRRRRVVESASWCRWQLSLMTKNSMNGSNSQQSA